MSPTDVVKVVQDLGYFWGPPLVALCILGAAIYVWSRKGYERLRALLGNWMVFTACVACLVGLPLFYRHYGVPAAFAANEAGILVAEVPGDTRREQQNAYAQAIQRLVADTPKAAGVVKVRLLKRPLVDDPDDQQEVASGIGRRLRASLVLRAIPVRGGYEPWLTIVGQSKFGNQESDGGTVSGIHVQRIEKVPLPKNEALVAQCAVAFAFYRWGHYEQAAEHLVKILNAPDLSSAARPRPYLSLALGNSRYFLRSSDPASMLPLAIQAYDLALQDWSRERNPDEWAETMNNRGSAYAQLPGPSRVANVEEAIRCFDRALQVYTRDRYPTEWAMTMGLRGNAYARLPGPDRAANLREAIHCYDQAIQVFTRDRYPADWAMTMISRGRAYGALPSPDLTANLREAIRCYDQALEVYTRDRYPTDWAIAMCNRAAAYQGLPGTDRTGYLEEAIRCYDQALQVYTRDSYPAEWAAVMRGRGDAYRDLPGPDRTASLTEAIRCYDQALEVYSRSRYPTEWATTMHGRGNAFAELPGPDRAANVREAIRCWRQVIPIYESQGFAEYTANIRRAIEQSQKELGPSAGKR